MNASAHLLEWLPLTMLQNIDNVGLGQIDTVMAVNVECKMIYRVIAGYNASYSSDEVWYKLVQIII